MQETIVKDTRTCEVCGARVRNLNPKTTTCSPGCTKAKKCIFFTKGKGCARRDKCDCFGQLLHDSFGEYDTGGYIQ